MFDHWALDKKKEVLDSHSCPAVFFLITVSVKVATCLYWCLHSNQLRATDLHITSPIFLLTESHRDKKEKLEVFFLGLKLFQMSSSVIILILPQFILNIAFRGNLDWSQLSA